MSFFLVVAGLWVGLIVIRYVVTIVQLLKIELHVPAMRFVDPELIPSGTRSLLETTAQTLVGLGFARPLYIESEPGSILPGVNEPEYELLLDHPSEPAMAAIRVHEDGSPHEPTRVTFLTLFEDGGMLHTVNAFKHLCFAQNAKTIIEDPLAPELHGQWNSHMFFTRARGLRPTLLSGDLLEIFRSTQGDGLRHGVERGELAEKEQGRFVLTIRGAFRLATKMISASSKIARYRKERALHTKPSVLPLDVQVSLYRKMKAFQAKQTPRGIMVWIFVISAVLSLLSFVPWSEGLAGAGVLAAVVLVHELGHFLAMRAFGYKDTTIFLLPFFGGATIGSKENVKPREEMIVLLAGPVPGLIAGILMFYFGFAETELGLQTALLFIAVNALNLLPIFPLDGGRIARSLLFSRSIALDILFQIGAVVICFVAAYAAKSWLLAIPGAFTLLGLSRSVKVSRLSAKVGSVGPRDVEVLRTVNEALPPNVSYSERFGLARMIERQMATVKTTLLGGVAWGAVYSIVLAAGIGGTALVLRRHLSEGEEQLKIHTRAMFDRTPSISERRVEHGCGRRDIFGALQVGAPEEGLALFVCKQPEHRRGFAAAAGNHPLLFWPAPWDEPPPSERVLHIRKTLGAIAEGRLLPDADPQAVELYERWLENPDDQTGIDAIRTLAGVGSATTAMFQSVTLEEHDDFLLGYISFRGGLRDTPKIVDWFCAFGCSTLEARMKTTE